MRVPTTATTTGATTLKLIGRARAPTAPATAAGENTAPSTTTTTIGGGRQPRR